MEGVWWRHQWLEAIEASDLKPMARFVAMIYADHARDKRIAWVALDVLIRKTGLGRTQAKKWRCALVEAGWLAEIEAARQHRATRYVLTIPRGSEVRPSAGAPRGSENRPSDEGQGVTSENQGVGNGTPGGRVADPDQSSDQSNHQSSSSARAHLAYLLRWEEEDERLDLLNDFLTHHNVKKAKPWLTSCHEAGDLERNYLAFVKEQSSGWGGIPTIQQVRRMEAERDAQEEQQRAWRQNSSTREKCPTCNAPQEVVHYYDCPDRSWAPEGVDPDLMSNLCSSGCGPFVKWHTNDGPKCRVCGEIQFEKEKTA